MRKLQQAPQAALVRVQMRSSNAVGAAAVQTQLQDAATSLKLAVGTLYLTTLASKLLSS